ncbi:MAG: hypothetical protein KGH71_05980 [Candidatus Micrarchaeota archaeon]|nr:hypothetical protein [Candidatus Micrarchaeota archaeon]
MGDAVGLKGAAQPSKREGCTPETAAKIATLKALLKNLDPEIKNKDLNSQKAMQILAERNLGGILEKYHSEELKRKIANKLLDEINNGTKQWSEKRALKMLETLEHESVQNVLNKYPVKEAIAIAETLMEKSYSSGIGYASHRGAHFYPMRKNSIDNVAQVLALDEVMAPFSSYDPSIAWVMLMQYTNQLFTFKPDKLREQAVEFAQALSIPHVTNNLNRLAGIDDKATLTAVSNLFIGMGRVMDVEIFTEIANLLGMCNPYLASAITFDFAQYFEGPKRDRKRILEVVRLMQDKEIIERLNSKVVMGMFYATSFTVNAGMEFRDRAMMLRAIEFYTTHEKMIRQMEGLAWTEGGGVICKIIKLDLDEVCTNKHGVKCVIMYAASGGAFLRPTKQNLKNYERELLAHLKGKYGLSKELTMEEMGMLAGLGRNKIRKGIQIINDSQDESVKKYSLRNQQLLRLDYTKEQLAEYAAVALLGSRDAKKEAKAIGIFSEIVGRDKLNRARNEINTKYRELKAGIFAMAKANSGDALLYQRICAMLAEAKNEFIGDTLEGINCNDLSVKSAGFVRAAESRNILDYDSRVQMACVFLPRSNDVYGYAADDEIVMVKYEIGKKRLGGAICSMTGGNFLVDSVEGHRIFRKDSIFEIVFSDLVERAREKNAQRIVFGKNGANKTSQMFIKYIEGKGLKDMTVEFRIKKNVYLETEKGSRALAMELRD